MLLLQKTKLNATCNSSIKGFGALLWLQQALHIAPVTVQIEQFRIQMPYRKLHGIAPSFPADCSSPSIRLVLYSPE